MSATFRLREVLGPQLYEHRKNLNYHASRRKALVGGRHIACFTCVMPPPRGRRSGSIRSCCKGGYMDKDLNTRGTENEIKGKAKEMKGKVRGDLGDMTDNESEHIKGRAEETKGKFQKNFGKTERNLDRDKI